MVLMPMNLRLETAAGLEEYRIYEGSVEVRKLRSSDSGQSGEGQAKDEWQQLSHTDLATHVHENTVVAQWLRKRIGWQRLLRLCVNPETLEEFGIAENTLDRYAA